MNGVNKTLYIPLYGKAFVSKKSLFLSDKKAEEIWDAEGFTLKGKSKSKWLAYYMGIRSAVFDAWLSQQLEGAENVAVIHIGCGMDSRVLRVHTHHAWYDVDFPQVIEERRRYFTESDSYTMLAADVRVTGWIEEIPAYDKAIVVMEGVSMYLSPNELSSTLETICRHFESVSLLVDCYTTLAAKMSKYKNPINDVGVTTVYGTDNPDLLSVGGLEFVKEHEMTPQRYIDELSGMEKKIFKKLYAGKFAKKLYKLFEYRK